MPLELTQPWYLLGLLVLPVVGVVLLPRADRLLAVAARRVARRPHRGRRAARRRALRPDVAQAVEGPYVVFVIDDSLSVGDEGEYEAEKFLDERAPRPRANNKVAFVRFGAEPGAVVNDRGGRPSSSTSRARTSPPRWKSAAAAIPPSHVPRLVLLSDGNQTAGDALRTALRGGVPVYTVPLPVAHGTGSAGVRRERPGPGPRRRAVLRRGRRSTRTTTTRATSRSSAAPPGRRREGEGQGRAERVPVPPAGHRRADGRVHRPHQGLQGQAARQQRGQGAGVHEQYVN